MKTKHFRLLAVTLMLVAAIFVPSVVWADGITPSKPANGSGTADSPYEISTADELYWFAELVNGSSSTDGLGLPGTKNKDVWAKLTADIEVNKNVIDESGNLNSGTFTDWTPIGNANNIYAGTFDGQGHTVSGLYFNDTNTSYVGLFGYSCGTIRNVGVVGSYFNANQYVGGVCGLNDGGTITNCYNTGSLSVDLIFLDYVGGVCGYNNNGTIENSHNTGSVSGDGSVGGVCGENNKGTIENSHNTGVVSGSNYIGGVCGRNYAYSYTTEAATATLENCYNTGSVSGTGSYVGGVCGQNVANSTSTGTATATTVNCHNTGAVSGNYYVGGVCGQNYGTIENCHNTGVVSGSNYIGGVCGQNNDGTIENCYYLGGTATGGIKGADVAGSAEVKTTEEFASGEVCCLLNGSSPYGVWGQRIGTDGYPVLGSDYKVIKAAQDGLEGTTYWATFSNWDSNAELMVAEGNVYNATVSNCTLTLAERSDNKVAAGEGVLLKANSEYVNAKNISEDVTAAAEGDNDLLATPKEAGMITAEDGYTLYRLTYNKTSTKEGMGFYLGKVGDITNGSQLEVVPGEAYLNVLTTEATEPDTAALVSGFAFGGDSESTGIECITITDESSHGNAVEGVYDLMGRKVSNPVNGLYIKNGKKVIINDR